MAAYRGRMKLFEEVLAEDVIDLQKLKSLCFQGIPDEQGMRSLCWKLMLGYLPCERSQWKETLEKQRETYDHFLNETIATPAPGPDDAPRIDVTMEDHPLNPNPDSKWQTFFKDNEVLLQIDKDVRRLCPDIAFFQRPTDYPNKKIADDPNVERLYKRVEYCALKSANVTRKGLGVTKLTLLRRKANEEYAPLPKNQEAHWEVVERLLFVFAKLNPGQGYVQGMNEIIGPIYLVFASDPSPEWKEHAEADCFFCFTNLMSEIRDFFIKTMDDSDTGISAMMTKLADKLKSREYPIWLRLQKLELQPQFYSFRWITLLLSQEFPLPDVIRIWDSLFADTHRFEFLLDVCCAMLVLLKPDILGGDFPCNMKLLQVSPEPNQDSCEVQDAAGESFYLMDSLQTIVNTFGNEIPEMNLIKNGNYLHKFFRNLGNDTEDFDLDENEIENGNLGLEKTLLDVCEENRQPFVDEPEMNVAKSDREEVFFKKIEAIETQKLILDNPQKNYKLDFKEKDFKCNDGHITRSGLLQGQADTCVLPQNLDEYGEDALLKKFETIAAMKFPWDNLQNDKKHATENNTEMENNGFEILADNFEYDEELKKNRALTDLLFPLVNPKQNNKILQKGETFKHEGSRCECLNCFCKIDMCAPKNIHRENNDSVASGRFKNDTNFERIIFVPQFKIDRGSDLSDIIKENGYGVVLSDIPIANGKNGVLSDIPIENNNDSSVSDIGISGEKADFYFLDSEIKMDADENSDSHSATSRPSSPNQMREMLYQLHDSPMNSPVHSRESLDNMEYISDFMTENANLSKYLHCLSTVNNTNCCDSV